MIGKTVSHFYRVVFFCLLYTMIGMILFPGSINYSSLGISLGVFFFHS